MSVKKDDINRRDLKALLRTIDFTEKEASVYLALLEVGESPKAELARKAKIKRPTLYLVLEQLEQKKALVRRRDGPREFIRAVSPYALAAQREQVTGNFIATIPALLSISSSNSRSPTLIPILGVDDVISSMRDRLNAQSELLFWADKNLQFSNQKLLRDYQVPYRKRRIEKGIWTRGIIPYEPVQSKIRDERLVESQNLYLELKRRQDSELREFVFVPRNPLAQESEIWIFDDKVDFYSSQTCIGARIQSEPFAQTMRAIFISELTTARELETRLLSLRDRRRLRGGTT